MSPRHSIVDVLGEASPTQVAACLGEVTARDVVQALSAPRLLPQKHAAVLFSPAALELLEPMAQRAQQVTRLRFGRTITLYAPVYLSSRCVNHCVYCGFAANRKLKRTTLQVAQAVTEAQLLAAQGIRHLLLVSGEDRRHFGIDTVCGIARALRQRGLAASIAVEIFPCTCTDYRRLVDAGVDGLVLYQETYDRERYAQLHPCGPKRDFVGRLMAMEAGGEASFHSLGIGALLGLAPHRVDAVYLALHADHLTRTFPGSRIAISFPRLRPVRATSHPIWPVTDADLVQLVVGTRLMFTDAEIVISTREAARLRDRLVHLGVTRISAGSCTVPGGYAQARERQPRDEIDGQFSVSDRRGVSEIAASLRAAGLDVVTKDFDNALCGGRD